jgi:hypothetical protein
MARNAPPEKTTLKHRIQQNTPSKTFRRRTISPNRPKTATIALGFMRRKHRR